MKKIVLFLAALNMAIFAQEPERFAVYVSGAGEAGVNKSLGNKMTAAISHSGQYAEIRDPDAFYKEVAKKTEPGAIQVAEIAKKHGASFLCAVGATEVLGTHSFSARLIRTDNLQVAKVVSLDHQIKSVEDLTVISNEIAARLLNISPAQTAAPRPPQAAPAAPVPVPAASLAPQAPAMDTEGAPAAAAEQCKETYNINELIFIVQNGFPAQFKDCATKLAKDIALSKVPFSKTPAPEPKSYMTQCVMDGVKEKIPEGFPGADKIIGNIQSFMLNILSLAMSGSSIDPKKLLSAIGEMNISELLSGIKNLSAENPCVADEPYEPPAIEEAKEEKDSGAGEARGKGKSAFSLGIRGGMNLSHLRAYNGGRDGAYESAMGFQAGLAFDFALSSMSHIQPSLMYMRKGAEDSRLSGHALTSHYIEIPVLLSIKLSALRLGAGPYIGISAGSSLGNFEENDFGISAGLGFDIGKLYIGAFYDYGMASISSGKRAEHYNRSIGFNFGVNL